MIEEDNFAEDFQNLDLSGQEIVAKEFDDCTFTKSDFSHTAFKQCKFITCHFSRCDLSLIEVLDSQFNGCHFEDCKVIGVDWTKASWSALTQRELKFKRTVLNDSSFWGLKLESIMISSCEARDVDFREANLTKADLSDTDFSCALFRNTNLTEANFSYASNFDIDVRVNTVRGAKFSRYDVWRLLSGLDIVLVD